MLLAALVAVAALTVATTRLAIRVAAGRERFAPAIPPR